jgi:hypothetical protein
MMIGIDIGGSKVAAGLGFRFRATFFAGGGRHGRRVERARASGRLKPAARRAYE